jgi:hypothetical protein
MAIGVGFCPDISDWSAHSWIYLVKGWFAAAPEDVHEEIGNSVKDVLTIATGS